MTADQTLPVEQDLSDDADRAARRLDEVEALSGIGSWEWEIAADALYWSRQLRRIYGAEGWNRSFGYDDFIGRVHPDDRAEVRGIVRAALEAGTTFEIDHRIVLDDGAIRHIHSRGYVIRADDGTPVRMLGTAQDVTRAREAEAERAAEAERSAAGRARDDALALLAHDLRSPLAVVVGYVQLLARQARDGAVEIDRVRSYIGRIEESARQMTSLLDDLLADADAEAGNEPIETEPTDLAETIRRIAAHHAAVGASSGIVAEVPDHEVVAEVNRPKLERALHNLVTNAIKYGGDAGPVSVGLAEEPAEVAIVVSDDGIGIPATDLPHVFERFHRGSNATGRVNGLGLGLTSVLRAVEAHRGAIEVSSAEGVGTAFCIRLPRRR